MSQKEVVLVMKAPSRSINALDAPEISSNRPLLSILDRHKATIRPLFRRLPITPAETSAAPSAQESELKKITEEQSRYFSVHVADEKVDSLIHDLKSVDEIETVYVKPAVQNPLAPSEPATDDGIFAATDGELPDFSPRQGYLYASPGGIDAQYAWTLPGGQGTDIRIIDIEGGWQLSHIDLLQNQGGLVGGTAYPDVAWRNHGTAVFGEIGGDIDGRGVNGLAPEASLSAVSHGGLGSAGAIELASQRLRSGDILLLEMHRPGPRYNYADRGDQLGFIAVEWWQDDLLAIRSATARGIIVVEAAGNGAENLDDPLYDAPGANFPASWSNPFRGGAADSGAVVVGAGAPPSGAYGPDRSRLDFSNYGSRVDCQGWGRGVVTTGYGDLYRNPADKENEDYWYTARFSGTSSASPIVVGAIACLQGIAKRRGQLLQPASVRQLLRVTGSMQQASTGSPISQRIGARPDLRQLIQAASLIS